MAKKVPAARDEPVAKDDGRCALLSDEQATWDHKANFTMWLRGETQQLLEINAKRYLTKKSSAKGCCVLYQDISDVGQHSKNRVVFLSRVHAV